MPEKFYLTTPIYYVNARPHIGHAYTTIVADVLARRARMEGRPTYFLTGTDEHGQKIERSAAAAGIPPQQFADQVSRSFSDLWARMGITHDQFIRTTGEAHKRGVQKLFRTLQDNGQIYLSSYTGSYCVSDEAFVDLPAGTPCPDCGRILETVTEENYFFRLSDYQLPLLNLIESGQLAIEPETRRNEVLSFLRGPVPSPTEIIPGESARTAAGTPYTPGALRDLSISRSSFTWGIPVPGDEKHVIYVWLDALANYITALGYGSDDDSLFQKFWPANLHIVGKEIIRFHCVYWPAFLLAAGLPLPRKVVAHGWLLFDDAKMSKSKGNIVRTETILDAFGTLCPAPLTPTSLLSSRSAAQGSAVPPPVILSEAQSAQSKNPHDLEPAHAVNALSTTHIAPAVATVPSSADSPSLLSSRSAADGSAVYPTPHDRNLFAADVLRYFLLREIPFGQDGSFSFDALITRYNADLANGYGNLVSRTLKMLQQSFDSVIPTPERSRLVVGLVESKQGSDRKEQSHNDAYRLSPGTAEVAQATLMLSALHRQSSETRVSEVLGAIQQQVAITDSYISFAKPWVLAKSDGEEDHKKLIEVLYTAAESIRIITILLHPILPYATTRVWQQLGLPPEALTTYNSEQTTLTWGGLQPGTRLGPLAPIFPRADKLLVEKMISMENAPASPQQDLTAVTAQADAATSTATEFPETPLASEAGKPGPSRFMDESFAAPPAPLAPSDPAAGPRTTNFAEPAPGDHVAGSAASTTERPGTPHHTEAHPSGIFSGQTPPDASPQITIDDFAKIELRVAQVIVAERIPKADKLLRLEVDLGYEKRQILSGIAEWYTPEELLGRRIVVITNLAPRKMRGLESHGMLLAASTEGGKPHLATFADAADLPLGSRLK